MSVITENSSLGQDNTAFCWCCFVLPVGRRTVVRRGAYRIVIQQMVSFFEFFFGIECTEYQSPCHLLRIFPPCRINEIWGEPPAPICGWRHPPIRCEAEDRRLLEGWAAIHVVKFAMDGPAIALSSLAFSLTSTPSPHPGRPTTG